MSGMRLLFPFIAFVAACTADDAREAAASASAPDGVATQRATPRAEQEPRTVPHDPGATDDVVERGVAAAAALTTELMSRVTMALEKGSPAYAIDFCSERALPVTTAVADELGVDIKRTSSQIRNPANAPDAGEQAALDYFAAELASGGA